MNFIKLPVRISVSIVFTQDEVFPRVYIAQNLYQRLSNLLTKSHVKSSAEKKTKPKGNFASLNPHDNTTKKPFLLTPKTHQQRNTLKNKRERETKRKRNLSKTINRSSCCCP